MQRTQANMNSPNPSSPNKLTSDNYEAWAIRSRIKLLAKGCWEVVEGSEPKPVGDRSSEMKWMQTNYTALASIMDWVDDSQLNHIRDCATANEAWTKLRAIHESKGMQRVLSLSLSLLNFQIDKNESVDSATERLSRMTRDLGQLGAPITESLKISILLNSLPEPWIIRLAGTESLRWADMVARVKLEERWQRDRGAATVLAVYEVGASGQRYNERRRLVPLETNGAKKNDGNMQRGGDLLDEGVGSESGDTENGNEEADNGNDMFSNPMRKLSNPKTQTPPGPARKWGPSETGLDQSPSYFAQPFMGYNNTVRTSYPPPQTTPRPNPMPNVNGYNYNPFQPQIYPPSQTSPKPNFVQPVSPFNPYQQNQHQPTPQQRRTSMSSFNPQANTVQSPSSEVPSPDALNGLGGPFNRPKGSRPIQIVNPNTGARVRVEKPSPSASAAGQPIVVSSPSKTHSRSTSRSNKTEQERRDEMKATVARKLEEERLKKEENAKEAEKLKREADKLKREEDKKKREEEKKRKEEERLKKEEDWLKREEKRLLKEENSKKSREEQAYSKKRIQAEEDKNAPPPSAALVALKSARLIENFNSINYPPGIAPPNLTPNSIPGKFKYERDFLLQFQPVFTEKPAAGWDIRMRWAFGDIEPSRAQTSRTPSGPGPRNPNRKQIKSRKEDPEDSEKISESGEIETEMKET